MLGNIPDNPVYDFKQRRFKSPLVPVIAFTTIMLGSFVAGLLVDIPTFVFISFFSLATSVVTLVHDHWVLNSIVAPMSFVFTAVTITDIFNGDILLIAVHAPTMIISIIVTFRLKTSLVVMISFSTLYAAWIYTMLAWLPVGFYDCVAWVCDPVWMAIAVLVGCSIVSIVVTAKNFILKFWGKEVSCKGGICPF